MKKKNISMQSLIDSIVAPEGFSREEGEGSNKGIKRSLPDKWNVGTRWVEIRNDLDMIRIVFEVHPPREDDQALTVTGHTCYRDSPDASFFRSFDAYGVSDSFYMGLWDDDLEDPCEIIQEQLQRVSRSLERCKTAISVPGIGFSVQPADKDRISVILRSGKPYTFSPRGFGTGKVLCTRCPSWSSFRAPRELCAFFDVPELFMWSIDCD